MFAACDRPTIIYSRNKKISFSLLNTSNASEITGMTCFHSENFPDCLALTSDSSLIIGTVEDIKKLDIRKFPLSEAPKRIAHNPAVAMYAGKFNHFETLFI